MVRQSEDWSGAPKRPNVNGFETQSLLFSFLFFFFFTYYITILLLVLLYPRTVRCCVVLFCFFFLLNLSKFFAVFFFEFLVFIPPSRFVFFSRLEFKALTSPPPPHYTAYSHILLQSRLIWNIVTTKWIITNLYYLNRKCIEIVLFLRQNKY